MKKGFTLSEVLITLGIVGVVAVLTIPAIMKNYRDKTYIAQLKKVYGQLSEATQTIITDEQSDNFYHTTGGVKQSCSNINDGICEKGAGYFLNKYLKIVHNNCAEGYKCISNNYTNAAGETVGGINDKSYCVQTANGATICTSYEPSVSGIADKACLSLIIDVNGPAKPNITGKDVFAVDIHNDGSISDYYSGCSDGNKGCDPTLCNTDKTSIFSAACGCLNSVVEEGWKYKD